MELFEPVGEAGWLGLWIGLPVVQSNWMDARTARDCGLLRVEGWG